MTRQPLDKNRKDYPSVFDVPKTEKRPFTSLELDLFKHLLSAEMRGIDLRKDLEDVDGFKLITHRIAHSSPRTKITHYVLAFFGCAADSPGEITSFVWALHNLAAKSGFQKEITLSSLADLFSDGMPTKKAHQVCWDAQKVNANPDNALDHLYCWS